MNKADIEILRKTIYWVVLSISISAIAIVFTLYHYNMSLERLSVTELSLANAKSDSESSYSDLLILQRNLPKFQSMLDNGLIGQEFRLDWVETLREVSEELKLQRFEYRIDEQRPYTDTRFGVSGDYKIMSSEMHLSMQLLHEGDFIKIVDALKTKAKGTFYVDDCEFHRVQKKLITNAALNIGAECNFTWFTIIYNNMNVAGRS